MPNLTQNFESMRGGMAGLSIFLHIRERSRGLTLQRPRADFAELFVEVLNKYIEQDGFDSSNPDVMFAYIMKVQVEHYGLYLLMRTLRQAFGESPVSAPFEPVFSHTGSEMPGLGSTMEDSLIRGINRALLQLELVVPRNGSETMMKTKIGIAEAMLGDIFWPMKSTLDKDLPGGFDGFISYFSVQHPWWNFVLLKLAAIFEGKETLDQNEVHFRDWWSGQPPSYQMNYPKKRAANSAV